MTRLRAALAALLGLALLAEPGLSVAQRPQLTRAQALASLEQAEPAVRAAGIARLAEVGTMPDTDRLVHRLDDDDEQVRELANLAMWQIWGRSGDPAIDALFQRGVEQMQADALQDALATFSEIIRRKPAFAEGWNKRATIYFLLGRNELSLKDCHEVLKRNRHHYGALSGMGQIYLNLDDPDRALVHFQRALKVNPHLAGVVEAVRLLEQQQAQTRRRTT